MSTKPIIWLIDTSIFLNILDVPQFNQNRKAVLNEFSNKITSKDTFLLPFTSILETGNHIAHISESNQRQHFAQKFTEEVIKSLEGEAPWKLLEFPNPINLRSWLSEFPNRAQSKIGLGDCLIIKQWEEQCEKFGAYTVKIWSLDSHLQGYECNY